MIFVTVGTHEQPFDRLVKEIDNLIHLGAIKEDVFIQTGYCLYKPQYCKYSEFLPFDTMMSYLKNTDCIITHGGTGSIMLALYHNKIPVVFPRQKKFNEHIDDHQVLFTKTLEQKKKIIAVYDSSNLEMTIRKYNELTNEILDQYNIESNDILSKSTLFSQKINDICMNLVNRYDRKKL